MHEKHIANIILNGESLETFPLRPGTKLIQDHLHPFVQAAWRQEGAWLVNKVAGAQGLQVKSEPLSFYCS